jgi:uncharacterized protein YbjT (DUF2867 family)
MKIILFGASGLVGRGVLRECLLDSAVSEVLVVGRSPLAAESHLPSTKLSELVVPDMFDYSACEDRLSGFDACFFCLGVPVNAMFNEQQYVRLTYDLTLAAANVIARLNPRITMTYVSGAGTDSTGKSKNLWLRVKGQTEQALLALPIGRAFMFRPLAVQAVNGESARNVLYRTAFTLSSPFIALGRRLFPKWIVTTEQMGKAMLSVTKNGHPQSVLESQAIAQI